MSTRNSGESDLSTGFRVGMDELRIHAFGHPSSAGGGWHGTKFWRAEDGRKARIKRVWVARRLSETVRVMQSWIPPGKREFLGTPGSDEQLMQTALDSIAAESGLMSSVLPHVEVAEVHVAFDWPCLDDHDPVGVISKGSVAHGRQITSPSSRDSFPLGPKTFYSRWLGGVSTRRSEVFMAFYTYHSDSAERFLRAEVRYKKRRSLHRIPGYSTRLLDAQSAFPALRHDAAVRLSKALRFVKAGPDPERLPELPGLLAVEMMMHGYREALSRGTDRGFSRSSLATYANRYKLGVLGQDQSERTLFARIQSDIDFLIGSPY